MNTYYPRVGIHKTGETMSLLTQAWLENPMSIRGVLVEVVVTISGVDTTLYLSNIGYVTGSSDVTFQPVLANSISFSESISLDSSISMSFGDLEINNYNGEYDIWLDSTYVWSNRPIKVYVGDPLWVCNTITDVRNNFELVFNGLVADVDSKSRDSINIRVRDKLERLNAPITENKLGTYGTWGASGGQTNQDSIRPLVFGEVHNISPLLVDPSQIEYMVNDGNTELIIEIRDNGVPIYTHNGTAVTLNVGIPSGNLTGAVVTLSGGTFKMSQKVAGTITASVQGVKNSINLTTGALIPGTYNNNIANLIALICTQYGKSTTRLTAADLDLPNLAAFAAAHTEAVGIYIQEKTNVLEVCQTLAASVGAQVYMNRLGKLQLIRLGSNITTGLAVTTPITDSDILHHSLQIVNKSEVVAATKLGYCRNWTTQTGLLTGIPTAHKDMFSTEEYTNTVVDSSVQTAYKLNAEPEVRDTLLIVKADADAEAARLNNYYKVPKITYSFTGGSRLLSLLLGQEVTIIHNRFNLYNGGSGRVGQVIGLRPNWSQGTIDVEVII